jgi:hypothetical protein
MNENIIIYGSYLGGKLNILVFLLKEFNLLQKRCQKNLKKKRFDYIYLKII